MFSTKFATTVQLAVTAFVVKVFPTSVPPQVPVTVPMWEPVPGVSVPWPGASKQATSSSVIHGDDCSRED